MAQAATLPAPLLSAEKSVLAAQLIEGLDGSALHWLSGYMAGAAARATDGVSTRIPAQAIENLRLTVLYGSQTGNAKRVAEELAARAEADGLVVRLVRADAYPLHELKTERLLYVVVSTHSTGDAVEPPDDSRTFIEHLQSHRAPKLPELSYAVLALGDTSYPDFCAIGRRLDERLSELGAVRLFPRGDADVDIESVADPWFDTALERARLRLETSTADALHAPASGVVTPLHPTRTAWTRQHP
ncbi:MAG TPA: flavodoxin domain-containing protein, partial [Oleiagrimonas sp.]|nr:flavodoxin domain-containing protein [Oleiagrimonas sp.]